MAYSEKLFLVHCGYYDENAGQGIYEIHTNLFVVGESYEEALQKVKAFPEFIQKKMHVDGLVHIESVQGFEVNLQKTESSESKIYRARPNRFVKEMKGKPIKNGA